MLNPSSSFQPAFDGWTVQVITTVLPKPVQVDGATVTKAPTSVVWTADAAHQIGQNQFQTFTLSVGRLPVAGTTVELPAAQGYTDGSTVNWGDAAAADHDHASAAPSVAASDAEESHPAPSFVTTAAESDGTQAGATASATQASAVAPAASTSSSGGEAAGWIGLAAGLIGLAGARCSCGCCFGLAVMWPCVTPARRALPVVTLVSSGSG